MGQRWKTRPEFLIAAMQWNISWSPSDLQASNKVVSELHAYS